jgi:5-methylcytosine-specific restriction endonuclease McrA
MVVKRKTNTRKRDRPKLQYKRFLKTKYWKEVRKQVLVRDNYQCQLCHGKAEQVHHLSYKHHGAELEHLEDMISLCNLCHKNMHEIK